MNSTKIQIDTDLPNTQIDKPKDPITIYKPNWPDLLESINPKASPWEKFQQSQLIQWFDYPEPESILNIVQGGHTYKMLSLQSISLWQGKQKSKKTTALALAIVAVLRYCHGIDQGSDWVRFVGLRKGRIIFFDTEQGESYGARTMKLILALLGLETSEYLIYVDLREYSPAERWEIINAGIENTPDVLWVVIDGVVDIMDDFMDHKEGKAVISDLARLSSRFNIHVSGVLHQNKGTSTDARAHVGTIFTQKCEIEIMAEVDPNCRARSFIHCRSPRHLPFEPFAIEWPIGELPKIVQASAEEIKASNSPIGRKLVSLTDFDDDFYQIMLQGIFKDEPEPKYPELWRAIKVYMEMQNKKIGDNKAKETVTYLVSKGYLEKPEGEVKFYRFKNRFSLTP